MRGAHHAGDELYEALLSHALKEPPSGVSETRRIVTKKRHYIMPVICFFFLSDFRWLFAAILFPYAAGLFRPQSATYDPGAGRIVVCTVKFGGCFTGCSEVEICD